MAYMDGRCVDANSMWLVPGQSILTIEERHPGALSAAKTHTGKLVALPQQYTDREKFLRWLGFNPKPKYLRMAIRHDAGENHTDKFSYKPLETDKAELELLPDGRVVPFHHNLDC